MFYRPWKDSSNPKSPMTPADWDRVYDAMKRGELTIKIPSQIKMEE